MLDTRSSTRCDIQQGDLVTSGPGTELWIGRGCGFHFRLLWLFFHASGYVFGFGLGFGFGSGFGFG